MKDNRRKLHIALFAAYAALMLWLLLHRSGYVNGIPYLQQMKANLIPFRTMRLFFRLLFHHRPRLVRAAVINLAGNVAMFVPLGYLLPAASEKKPTFFRTVLSAAGLIIAVEVLQLFTLLGSCDVDDLILNMVGVVLGFLLWKLRRK